MTDIIESPTLYRCIIGVTNNRPYDTSIFVSNNTTYHNIISYKELISLNKHIKYKQEPTNNINLKTIYDLYFAENNLIMFRFLCSSDCCNGTNYMNSKITKKVMKFVKLITTRNNVIIEVSDHSMSAFFRNWDNEFMGLDCPIIISRHTTSGSFTMNALKDIMVTSVHPTLQQIAKMSDEQNINMTFQNMPSTQIFSIKENALFLVKVLSNGCETSKLREQEVNPVHCEFHYRNGVIVVSSTHWCNLENVNSSVNEDRLKIMYTQSFGHQASQVLEQELSSAPTPYHKKRIISQSVKKISSGIN